MADQYNFSDIFVSYSRKDDEFVKKVVEVLFDRGYEIWIDWDDIPHTVDWWQEIQAGIDASNTFIAILTDAFANSKICYKEVQYAVDNNKRIVPVIPESFDESKVEDLHPALKSANWFVFDDPDLPFAEDVDRLVEVIMLDVEYLRQHTRYLVRAREWQERNRDRSFLLRDNDAIEAEQWLREYHGRDPKPTSLQVEYIHACAKQREIDTSLRNDKRAVRFVDRRTIPTFLIVFVMMAYYVWQTFPVSSDDIGQFGRGEIVLGIGFTSGIIFAVIALYADELISMRFRSKWKLRLFFSWLFGWGFAGSFLGFVQLNYSYPEMDYVPLVTGGFVLATGTMLRTTFKLPIWLAFIIETIVLYIVIIGTSQIGPFADDPEFVAVFRFDNTGQMVSLGLLMSLVMSFGVFAWEIVSELLAIFSLELNHDNVLPEIVQSQPDDTPVRG